MSNQHKPDAVDWMMVGLVVIMFFLVGIFWVELFWADWVRR